MATGPKKGLQVAKTLGSGPDNGGFDTYEIASGYNTSIFTGDPVKLVSGKIQKAANGDATIGVFLGCSYIDANGTPQEKPYFPANYTSIYKIEAKVMDLKARTFFGVGDGTLEAVQAGSLYAVNLSSGNTFDGVSNLTVRTTASVVGATALPATGSAALVGTVSGLANSDTFTIKASSNAGTATTITILTATTRDQFMDALNAVPNISAELTSDLKLLVRATDGTNLVITDGTGTPLADSTILPTGTVNPVVAANAAMVKVVDVIDLDNKVVEVVLANSTF